jgi:hypothetical protein
MCLPHGYHATQGYPKQPPHIPFGWGEEGWCGKGDGQRNDPAATMATANAMMQQQMWPWRQVGMARATAVMAAVPVSRCEVVSDEVVG